MVKVTFQPIQLLNSRMRKFVPILLILVFASIGCKKEKSNEPCNPAEPEQWEKFIGDYRVYDTVGTYLYNMDIDHFSGFNTFGVEVDSIRIQNFADTFDLEFEFSFNLNKEYLQIGVHHPVYDYNGKRWHVDGNWNPPETPEEENTLVNDTILFWFTMDNIAFYIADTVPYYSCECKHVAVKQ